LTAVARFGKFTSTKEGGLNQALPAILSGARYMSANDLVSSIFNYERLESVRLQPAFLRFLVEVRFRVSQASACSGDPVSTVKLYKLCLKAAKRIKDNDHGSVLNLYTNSLAELLKQDEPNFGLEFEMICDFFNPYLKVRFTVH
jgi:hypothetical protein